MLRPSTNTYEAAKGKVVCFCYSTVYYCIVFYKTLDVSVIMTNDHFDDE